MASAEDDRHAFDFVIVGAGASAAGLLRELLLQILASEEGISVAILERGASACSSGGGEVQFESTHEAARSLQTWFDAAHYCTPKSMGQPSSIDPSLRTPGGSPTTMEASTPQAGLGHRVVDVPTGQGWGGSTNINAGLVTEPKYGGAVSDFDDWPGRWKGGELIRAAADEIIQVMEQSDALHYSSMNHAFLGLLSGETTSHNIKFDRVCTSSPGADNSNERMNYFQSLVEPLLIDHPELKANVTFLSGVQAERILIDCHPCEDSPRACTLECTARNSNTSPSRKLLIKAKREIILCAGAIGSPALLLASGIGHEEDLAKVGIKPWYETLTTDSHNVHRHLGVGRNLHDHLVLPRVLLSPRQVTKKSTNSICGLSDLTLVQPDRVAKIQLQIADGTQVEAMAAHFAAFAFCRKSILPLSWTIALCRALRFFLRWALELPYVKDWARNHFVFVNVCLMNPMSRGTITLEREGIGRERRRSPQYRVSIDPGYLANSSDLDALWLGWRESEHAKRHLLGGCVEVLPCMFKAGHGLWLLLRSVMDFVLLSRNDASHDSVPKWFQSYAALFANPYYHWCGSCAMGHGGEDDSSIVDDELRVRGIRGLKVCDASVFPGCVSVPTALTCAALGLACARDLFAKQCKESDNRDRST